MRNLISPEIYRRLIDRSRECATISRILHEWDRSGGSLVDYLALCVLHQSDREDALTSQLIEKRSMESNSTIILQHD